MSPVQKQKNLIATSAQRKLERQKQRMWAKLERQWNEQKSVNEAKTSTTKTSTKLGRHQQKTMNAAGTSPTKNSKPERNQQRRWTQLERQQQRTRPKLEHQQQKTWTKTGRQQKELKRTWKKKEEK